MYFIQHISKLGKAGDVWEKSERGLLAAFLQASDNRSMPRVKSGFQNAEREREQGFRSHSA